MNEKTVVRPHMVVQAETSQHAPNAALLVDFDNVTMGIRSDLQTQLRKLLNSAIIRGKVSVQRAYADWRRYPQYIVPLTEASIDLIFAPAVGANKKNATDIRLAIDALELVFTRPEIGTFILLSGDSDFSALVLKLKEYGKFVIGVGIRESSSDLLVQNCDEYYSYNELTGLAKTGEVEIVRHDAWELVVEAVQKMLRNGDVMRSDRLKQVMQSIDPSFDEKDVGCNRFSKFVVEAEKRGLVRLTKMENGQHAVDIGPNANVPVDHAAAAQTQSGKPDVTAGSPRGKRTARARGERDSKVRTLTLTLSESMELLKRALLAAGAMGDEATMADRAREGMVEIHGNDSDPVFEPNRFQRLLRQAHDADIIELIKSGGDDYMLKLSAAAAVEMEKIKDAAVTEQVAASEQQELGEELSGDAAAAAKPKRKAQKKSTTARKSFRTGARAATKKTPDDEVAPTAEAAETPAGDEAEAPQRTTRRKAVTKRKTTRSRARKTAEEQADDATLAGGEAGEAAVAAAPKGSIAKQAMASSTAKLNPRFRKGARTATPKPAATQEPSDADAKAAEPAPTPKAITSHRTLGVRTGSRGVRRPEKEPIERPEAEAERAKPLNEEPKLSDEEPKAGAESSRRDGPEPVASPPAPDSKPEPVEEAAMPREREDEGLGLFRKVTAAFQRAMGTGKDNTE